MDTDTFYAIVFTTPEAPTVALFRDKREAEKYAKRWYDDWEYRIEAVPDPVAEVRRLRAQLAEAERALREFGDHEYTCATTHHDDLFNTEHGIGCDCEYGKALLAAARQEPPQ